MAIFMIAVIKDTQTGKVAGFRLYNTEKDRYQDVPTQMLRNHIEYNGLKVTNLSVCESEIKGTCGVLSRYTQLDLDENIIGEKRPQTIVGITMDGATRVVDFLGRSSDCSPDKLEKIALDKRQGLSNASLVIPKEAGRKPFIRPIGEGFGKVGFHYDYLEKVFETPNQRNLVTKWKVRIIKPGEPCGREGCLTNDSGKPKVEFVSLDTFQSVSTYYLETLIEHPMNGLDLVGYAESWKIDGDNYKDIDNWLRSLKF